MDEFKVGMIVQLKSGGPKMTVAETETDSPAMIDKIKCQWFSGSKLEEGWFPPKSLKVIKEEQEK